MSSSSKTYIGLAVYSWLIAAMGILLLGLLVYAGLNLLQPYLWYDEAVQFWIGKGLNPDSPSFSTPGNFAAVFENNRYYNLDPGGFSLLLHAWSAISNQVIWLRLLPFLFFIASVAVAMYSAWLLTGRKHWAFLAGFMPFLISNWIQLSVELRAYSMEGMGSMLCIAGLLHLQQALSMKRLLAWSLVFCFFMSSRYTEVIMVAITSVYVLYLIYTHTANIKQAMVYSLVYALPLCLTVAGIYVWVMRIQNADMNALYYLPYLSRKLSLLWKPNVFWFNVFFLLNSIFFLVSFKVTALKPLRPLFFLASASNTVLILLSVAGFHPWGPFSYRCISLLIMQVACSGLALIAWLNSHWSQWQFGITVVLLFLLIGFSVSKHPKAIKRFKDKQNAYYAFKQHKVPANFKIYADYFQAPYMKYLFEYGDGKTWATPKYPAQFYLAKCTRHGFTQGNQSPYFDYLKTQPVMNDLLEYDWLLTPQLFQKGQHDAWKLLPGSSSVWVKKPNKEKDDDE